MFSLASCIEGLFFSSVILGILSVPFLYLWCISPFTFLSVIFVRLKDQRSCGQSSKVDSAYTLYIGRPRYYTYEIKVYLREYCFVSKKFDFNCKRYFSS